HDLHVVVASKLRAEDGKHVRAAAERGGVDHVQDARVVHTPRLPCLGTPKLVFLTTMKVVILAGGFGTRLSEETDLKPKPMVEIGGRPILWHIMQHYSSYGFNEFVIALGYRGEQIKRYIVDYCKLTSSLTVKLRSGDVMRHPTGEKCEWTVDLIDTGMN